MAPSPALVSGLFTGDETESIPESHDEIRLIIILWVFFFQSFFQTCGLTVGVSNQTETISAVAVVRSHSVGAVMHAGSQEEGAFIHICRGRDQRDSETGTLMEPCSLVCLLTVRKQGVLVFPSAMQRVLGLIRPPIESSHYVCT